jgi:hypothetical protein
MDEPATADAQAEAKLTIEAILADSGHPSRDPFAPGHEAARTEVEALYRLAWGTGEVEPFAASRTEESEPAAPAVPGAPAEESGQRAGLVDYTDAPLPEFEGVEWDTAGVTELRVLGRREGLADYVERGLVVAARCVGLEPPSGEEMDYQLAREWGSDLERNMLDAHAAWKMLPARYQRDLLARGADRHPSFVRFMAEVGAELRNPLTEHGMARMKAAYERRIAEEKAGT